MKMKEYLGKRCPYCNTEFTEKDNVVFCSVCDMPHHLECWQANQGCTTFGCTGMISEMIQNQPVAAPSPAPAGTQAAPVYPPQPAPAYQQPAPAYQQPSAPTYQQPAYQQPSAPAYQQPQAPTYQQPPVPAYQQAPAYQQSPPPAYAPAAPAAEGRVQPQNAAPAKRFDELKQSDKQRLFPEAKLILTGYSIVKDNEKDGQLFARFSFRQYSSKTVSAVLADVDCSDMWNTATEHLEDVQFLDLNADSKTEFGRTAPVKLGDPNSRNIDITIKSVVYSDGTSVAANSKGEALRETIPLEQYFSDEGLVAQYKRETTANAVNVPSRQATLQSCCCGALFDASVPVCPVCGVDFNASAALLDSDLLQSKLSAYLAAEEEKQRIKREQEEEARRRIEEAQRLSEERAQRELEEKRKAEEEAKKKKKRKRKRILITLVSVLAAAGLTVASILYFIPLLRYTIAKSDMEKKDYDKAISTFTALGDFSDSATMAKEAKYRQATDLMDDGQYVMAKKLFDGIKGYRDSNTKAQKCAVENTYQLAVKDFENKKYLDAANKFNSIKNQKTEAKEYALRSYYCYAQELFEDGKFKEAAVQFGNAGTYEDAVDMQKESQYRYGMERYEKKDYKTAYEYLSKVKTYKDVPDKIKDVTYQYGRQLLTQKSWAAAVGIFKGLGSYSDSAARMNEAKYGYVLAHKNNSDTTTYNYLKDLRAAGYKDSKSIYSSLYAWKVTCVINNSKSNTTTKQNTISKYDTIYCHIKLSGGPPGGETKISYSGYWPNGNSYSDKWDQKWADGWYGDCYFWYNTPSNGATGTFTVNFYDSDGNRIGSGSITIVN